MKQVFITGDVHHQNCRTYDYRHGYCDEMAYVKKYCEILSSYKLKATLFYTGKFLEKHCFASNFIEIGGHTYSAWDWYPKGLGTIFKKLFGCYYGPKWLQKRDIDKFFKIKKVISWRTHSYSSNKITRQLLVEKGVKYISDDIICDQPHHHRDIWEIPITVPPDDIFFKGRHNMKPNEKRQLIDRWFARFKDTIKDKDFIVLQLHPAIMKSLDNFKLFDKVCKYIHDLRFKTYFIKEVEL